MTQHIVRKTEPLKFVSAPQQANYAAAMSPGVARWLHGEAMTVLIAITSLLLFVIGQWRQEFTGFETRFAVFANEMLTLGPSWFPTTYGRPYPDYPATSTLLIWLLSLPGGEVTKFTAIIPTAIAAALNVALSWRLFRPVSLVWAFLVVCFEWLTVTFLTEARSISPDHWVALFTTCAFMAAVDSRSRSRGAMAPASWIYTVLLLSFAVRGPMGVVIPTGVVCSYFAVQGQWRSLWQFGLRALVLLLVCWAVLLGLAWQTGGSSFVQDVVRMQVSGRMNDADGPNYLEYFISGGGTYALGFLPALLVAALVLPQWRRAQTDPVLQRAVQMAGWMLVVLIGLSVPQGKKARYLLPMVPAMAALATYPLVQGGGHVMRLLRSVLHGLLLMLPGLCMVGVLAAKQMAAKKGWQVELPWMPVLACLALLQLGAAAIAVRWRGHVIARCGLALLAALALWGVNFSIREPAMLQLHAARDFVHAVEQIRQAQPAPMAFYRVVRDGSGTEYQVNVKGVFVADFVRQPAQLAALSYPLYLMVDEDKLGELHFDPGHSPQQVYRGSLYGSSFMVFYVADRAQILP